MEVRVEDDLSGRLLDSLQDRRIDFAVTIAPEQTGQLDFQPLFSDECLLVMREGDPLDATTPISWAALKLQVHRHGPGIECRMETTLPSLVRMLWSGHSMSAHTFQRSEA